MNSDSVIGPLFLYHPESESPAVLVLVNSRLAAISFASSLGVLFPGPLLLLQNATKGERKSACVPKFQSPFGGSTQNLGTKCEENLPHTA